MDRRLEQLAARLWPSNDNMRRKWLAAVRYLREQSKCGYLPDRQVERKDRTEVVYEHVSRTGSEPVVDQKIVVPIKR